MSKTLFFTPKKKGRDRERLGDAGPGPHLMNGNPVFRALWVQSACELEAVRMLPHCVKGVKAAIRATKPKQ